MINNIVHFITFDKFTNDYIKFMNKEMTEFNHIFYLMKRIKNSNYSIEKKENIIFYLPYELLNKKNEKILESTDKIIISGFFDFYLCLPFFKKELYKKVYIHYWGQDFYFLREKNIKAIVKKPIALYFYKRINNYVFLIDEDIREFKRITKIDGKNFFVASMPSYDIEEYSKIKNESRKKSECIKIVVGNNASPSNNHIIVLEYLSKFKDENLLVYCPLSYGNKKYSYDIINYGTSIFGKKFIALTKFIERENYFKFLSTCDIGIYNNDRQQALGNIEPMFRFGKKIYLKKNTSMYKYFEGRGFTIYNVDEIANMDFQDFCRNNGSLNNINTQKKYDDDCVSSIKKEWKNVFKS